MRDISIVIPARNEEFLGLTVQDILKNIEGNTEVIAVLDGYDKPIPDIPTDPRVRVLKYDVSIGQRAATNQAVKISDAKYIIKTDAHCAFDKGFDVKLMADMKDHWTMIPVMRNLHAFDFVCKPCGVREYQGATHPCPKCGGKMDREIIWMPRRGVSSDFYRFDKSLHFQYWKEFRDRPEAKQILAPTMSIQGSFFMLTREKYIELNICDEAHGSWGQQGVEVACKTWLSGGEVIVNKNTWYAHMFRTQGGDFGFPYHNNTVTQARKFSQDLWNSPFEELKKKFPPAIHDLKWLLNKFSPVPDWDYTKGILYYSYKDPKTPLFKFVRDQIKKSAGSKRIVSVTVSPLAFGDNIVLERGKYQGYLDMFHRILLGLQELDTDYVFFCEDDVLYSKDHFDFTPPKDDVYYYNMNCWQVRTSDGYAVTYDCKRLSGICANRKFLIEHYKKRIAICEAVGFSRKQGFEPGTHNRPERVDDFKADGWRSNTPILDLVDGKNSTERKWRPEDFRSQKNCQNWKVAEDGVIPGWGRWKDIYTTV